VSWAEAVFHVLAHAPGKSAASCWDRVYVAWIEERLGPASERSLGDDAATLATLLTDFEALARAQALAWVFPDPDAARAHAAEDLDAIAGGVDERALATCLTAGPAVEVLRAAAELELDGLAALGVPDFDREAFAMALDDVGRAAPLLARCRVEHVRSLPRRGRALDGSSIFVGVPGIAGAEIDHVAWQAAHEATVLECVRAKESGFGELEKRAIDLLGLRARDVGLGARHARWLATLDLSAIADIGDGAERAARRDA
jgi:hypothetical protein